MERKTILKIIGGITATIILGAVGSGVWERILAPGLDWLFRSGVDLISTVSLNYKNRIYESAAKGFHEDYSLRIFSITLLLFSLFLGIYAMRKHGRIYQIISQPLLNHKKGLQLAALIASVAFMYMTLFAVGRHDTINRITTYSMQSMEILRPHIGEQKYLLLKSEYLQIKSADEFVQFNDSIVQKAKANSLSLPDFKPL